MTFITDALADSTTRTLYLLFCMAVLVLPMIGLSVWYHARIKRTEGGAALMVRQNKSQIHSRRRPVHAVRLASEGIEMARDIESGKYGDHARTLQHKVYWVTSFWLLANILAFGLLLYADEINRPVGAAAPAAELTPAATQ